MKKSQLLVVVLSLGMLAACGGGSDGDSSSEQTPQFSVSASQSSITANENQAVSFTVNYSNESGTVSLSANTSNIANVESVDFSASGNNVTVTFNNLDTDISHNLVINAQDGSGAQANTTVAFSVSNESIKPKLVQYDAYKANLDNIINAQHESQVFKAITDIARMAGVLSDENYYETRLAFDNNLTQNQQQYTATLRQTIGETAPTSEKALDELLASFNTVHSQFVAPLNELITSNQSKANELFPALHLGELYTSDNGIVSQFWSNPNLGTGTPYSFSSEYEFLTNLVMSNDQTCSIEL